MNSSASDTSASLASGTTPETAASSRLDRQADSALPAIITGVGVGPGDPQLLTRAAVNSIAQAEVIAYFRGEKSPSMARKIAVDVIEKSVAAGAVEIEMAYPVTTSAPEHPGGYYGLMEEFYDTQAARLISYAEAGKNVVVLAEGDPLLYSSFMYLNDRFAAADLAVNIIPGVPGFAGATAAAGVGIARHEDVITVLSGTLPVPELARRLADTDAAIIMKLGRTFAGVREALRQAGLLERAVYIERATADTQRVLPVTEVDAAAVPYMSLIIVPGQGRLADAQGRHRTVLAAGHAAAIAGTESGETAGAGTVFVVGLGPGAMEWLTPEAEAVLSRVTHVVGYGPYVRRVPQREGLQRHVSGNTQEVERGRLALELAVATGQDVAVVSGGDAGIFGMASAVFEAAEVAQDNGEEELAAVDVHVVPGITAAQTVAARVGAPLGADWAMVSLSDRLKPWDVVEKRLRHIAQADLALAIYNPRSRSRPEQLFQARSIFLQEKSPDTVVIIGRSIGRVGERLEITTLGEFNPASVDMSCLVIIGASSTRELRTPTGERVWTPRFVE